MTILSVSTISDLRAYPTAGLVDGQQIAVSSYANEGDNGGGIFYWSAASTAPDDGGITIVPSSSNSLVAGVVIGTGDGTTKSFHYIIPAGSFVPGSIYIMAGPVMITDNYAGLMSGTGAVGGASYLNSIKINFTVPPLSGTQITANYNNTIIAGAWIRPYSGSVHSNWFGAVADGITDAAPSLNQGIYYCIENSKTFELDGLSYLINSPLMVFGYAFAPAGIASVKIKGQKTFDVTSIPQVTPPLFGTQILCNFNNAFGLCIEGARGSYISDLVFVGQNNFLSTVYNTPNNGALSNPATFVVGSCRDSQYSPYAGIAVDPFSTALPSDGGYPGYSDFYGVSVNSASTYDLVLERVNVSNFVVGLMIAPANTNNNNTTNIVCRDCNIVGNKVNVANGYNQGRNLYWYGGSSTFALTCFDGLSYGNGNGTPFKIYGCYLGYSKYLFAFNSMSGSNFYCTGAHAENFETIGFFGQNAHTPILDFGFYGCEFYPWTFPNTAAAPALLYACANVSFNDCFFSSVTSYLVGGKRQFPYRIISDQLNSQGTSIVAFKNSVFNFGFSDFPLAPSFNKVGELGISDCIRFENCVNQDQYGTFSNNNGNCILTDNIIATAPNDYVSYIMPFGTTLTVNAAGSEGLFQKNCSTDPDRTIALGVLTVTVSSTDPNQATFPYSNTGVIRVGDLIYTTTPVMLPCSPTGNFSCNTTCLGIVTTVDPVGLMVTIQGVPQGLPSGNFNLYSYWWARYSKPTTATLTAGSNTITIAAGGGAWKVTRKINGAGISPGTYVTGISGSTYTLSKSVTVSASGVRVYDANMYQFAGTPV